MSWRYFAALLIALVGNQETKAGYQFVQSFGAQGSGNGQFITPTGVALDSSGNLWVSDLFGNRIQKFSNNGTYLTQVGAPGTGNGQFNDPFGIAVDSSSNVWVADERNNRIQEFSSSGSYLSLGFAVFASVVDEKHEPRSRCG